MNFDHPLYRVYNQQDRLEEMLKEVRKCQGFILNVKKEQEVQGKITGLDDTEEWAKIQQGILVEEMSVESFHHALVIAWNAAEALRRSIIQNLNEADKLKIMDKHLWLRRRALPRG